MFFFFLIKRQPPRYKRTEKRFPYTTIFRSNLIIGGNQEFVERLQYSAPQRDFGHLRDWTKQIDTSIKIVRTQARRQPVVIATDPKNHVGMCMRSLRLN